MKNIFAICCFLSLSLCSLAQADESFLTDEERMSKAELVIVAQVLSIHSLKLTNENPPRKVAILKVLTSLKGKPESCYILASVGYVWPANQRSSQDISVTVNEQGKWYLSKEETGLYKIDSPGDFIKSIQ